MSLRSMVLIGAGAALVVAWYLVRPERQWLDSAVAGALRNAVAPRGFRPAPDAAAGVNPASPAAALLEGSFRGMYRDGQGTATVYGLNDGTRELRFTDFTIDNGPDLYVYLVASTDVPDDDSIERVGYVSLGRLKANSGDQTYAVPPEIDLVRYRVVTIWCRRFDVNFAAAGLEPYRGLD